MTRKDYEKIAQVMKSELQGGVDANSWMSIVNGLASMLKQDNERFDRHTFRNACGWVECTGLVSERC
jgi:hypothetical protein